MSDHTGLEAERKVIAWVFLSLDGYSAGPGNDMSRLAEHAGHEQMMAYTEGIWRGVSTAVMGRINYEGYFGYWPPVAKDPASTPRNRDLAIWLDTVEKVVFSRTMKRAEWQNTRVASNLETEIRALKAGPGHSGPEQCQHHPGPTPKRSAGRAPAVHGARTARRWPPPLPGRPPTIHVAACQRGDLPNRRGRAALRPTVI